MIRTIIKHTDDKIFLNADEVFEISKELQPGIYDIEFDNYNNFKNFKSLSIPVVYSLMPSKELQNIEAYMKKFLSKENYELCKKVKILRKTGILLHGNQGIGKSNYINNMIKNCIENHNACVFNIDNYMKFTAMIKLSKELRANQNNLFVFTFEEIDALFSYSSNEADFKNFMDGVNSIDNCLFLATTNYLSAVPASLTERPSRFKKVYSIEQSDNIDEVKLWLEGIYKSYMDNLSKTDIEKLHELCINKTIDEIKHTLIDYTMDMPKSIAKKQKKIGFK